MTKPETRNWRKKLSVLFVSARGNSGRRRRPLITTPKPTPFNQEEEENETNQREPNSPNTKSEWVITFKEKFNQQSSDGHVGSCWLNHSIYRVPRNIREINPKAYVPQVVSIGPYYRGKTHLKDMEKHKWRFLRNLLDRSGEKLEVFLESMLEMEEKTRLCYAEPIRDMDSQEFAEMMLLDGCFVLELLRTSVQGFIHCGYSWGDPIFTARGLLPCIQRDLLMLENQLPLFVLDRLFELGSEPDVQPYSVTQLALEFFNSIIAGGPLHVLPEEQGLHLLHVIRHNLLPSERATFECLRPNRDNQYQTHLMMHCVTSLRGSGIKFKKKNSKSFMDISFRDGVLYIPPLTIHDFSKSIFLNLMAFEQCYPHCSNDVTSYISFMDGLINCPRDVGYLRYHGIIDHGLGSEEEVAQLFNGLCREIAFDLNDCYLSGVSADVNRYFESKWHTWGASLKHRYFSNPWAIISLMVAVFLIALTFMQTFYTLFAYYMPPT